MSVMSRWGLFTSVITLNTNYTYDNISFKVELYKLTNKKYTWGLSNEFEYELQSFALLVIFAADSDPADSRTATVSKTHSPF